MITRAVGLVKSITDQTPEMTKAIVELAGQDYPAINFDPLTGPVSVGHQVLLNTTAVDLNLGTGGSHFIMANLSYPAERGAHETGPGHIMKMRYTPNQVKVLSVEEQDSLFHEVMTGCTSLDGTPVVCCTLHSMLPAAAAAVKAYDNNLRVAYLMTDGAALPLALSRIVSTLKNAGLIDGTVTTGHAFGGDLEAVSIYSGLLAARAVLKADVIIAAMGPGIVGTGTPFGFSGIEQASIIHAVHALEGQPIAVPRIGFGDARERHWGLSHHTRTILGKAVLISAFVSLAYMEEKKNNAVIEQMRQSGISSRHKIVLDDGEPGLSLLELKNIKVTTMGRSIVEEKEFFLTSSSAGRIAAKMGSGEKLKTWGEANKWI